MDLAVFRNQYPEYNDMPDETLTKALHNQFYGDMPYSEVQAQVNRRGLPSSFQPLERSPQKPFSRSVAEFVMEKSPLKPAIPWNEDRIQTPEEIVEEASFSSPGMAGMARKVKSPKTFPADPSLQGKSLRSIMRKERDPDAYLQRRDSPKWQDEQRAEVAKWEDTGTQNRAKIESGELAAPGSVPIRAPEITPDMTLTGALKAIGGIKDSMFFGKVERGQYSKSMPGAFNNKTGKPLEELVEPMEKWYGYRVTPEELFADIESEAMKTGSVKRELRRGNVESVLDEMEKVEYEKQLTKEFGSDYESNPAYKAHFDRVYQDESKNAVESGLKREVLEEVRGELEAKGHPASTIDDSGFDWGTGQWEEKTINPKGERKSLEPIGRKPK
jgi:hypothetical protein